MHAKFWLKTMLYRWTPGGLGYYHHLRSFQDPSYIHDRDKHPVRSKHHTTQGWKQRSDGFAYRNYDSYEEYVLHQKQKLDEMLKLNGGFNNLTITKYRLKFYRRFKWLHRFLFPDAHIICAGARQGSEVEVLRDLGYRNAYGIDLNPGPENPFVRSGDFMNIDAPTSTIDLIYTNCIDHAFDLDAFFAEHARVIKTDGYALYDISLNTKTDAGAFEAVSWDCEETIFLMMLKYFKSIEHIETDGDWKWVLLRGKRMQNTNREEESGNLHGQASHDAKN